MLMFVLLYIYNSYVLGMTGIEPKLKPESWAASFGADGVAHGRGSTHEVL